MREIAHRFLAAHGPATREDFARWWGIAPAPAGKLIRSLADEVAEVDIEGIRAWMPAELASDAQESAPSTQAPVRLLPAFDST